MGRAFANPTQVQVCSICVHVFGIYDNHGYTIVISMTYNYEGLKYLEDECVPMILMPQRLCSVAY